MIEKIRARLKSLAVPRRLFDPIAGAWQKRYAEDVGALLPVIEAAIQFERETNIPLDHKDLALAATRRKQLYDSVLTLQGRMIRR